MTASALMAIASMVIEARDWVADTDPGSLDYVLLDAVAGLLAERALALKTEETR